MAKVFNSLSFFLQFFYFIISLKINPVLQVTYYCRMHTSIDRFAEFTRQAKSPSFSPIRFIKYSTQASWTQNCYSLITCIYLRLIVVSNCLEKFLELAIFYHLLQHYSDPDKNGIFSDCLFNSNSFLILWSVRSSWIYLAIIITDFGLSWSDHHRMIPSTVKYHERSLHITRPKQVNLQSFFRMWSLSASHHLAKYYQHLHPLVQFIQCREMS